MPRKRICLMGSPLDNYYSRPFWKGAADEAEALGLDLVYLAGGVQRLYFDGFSRECALNESRSTLIYQFLDPNRFDGILIWGAQWAHDAPDATIASILARFAPLPVVSVGWAGPGIYSVLLDNYSGMRQMVSHLIQEHGHKKIAFLKNASAIAQREAEQRFQAYCDEMETNGIAIDKRLIIYGGEIEEEYKASFQERSAGEHWANLSLNKLIDERGLVPGRDFTALIGRDDNVALAAISNLKERGFSVPKDVAVCGFDDLKAGRCWDPPLTTVAQSFSEQAAQGVRQLHSILQGRNISAITYMGSAKPVIRESCGCLNQFMHRTFLELIGKGESFKRDPSITENIESVLEKIAEQKATMGDLAEAIRVSMRRLLEKEIDPMEMAEYLSAVRIRPALRNGAAILQASQALVGDLAQHLQMLQVINAQQYQDQLEIISRDTSRTYDLDVVLGAVETQLPDIGAKGCSIVLFLDPMDPLTGSRVIFSSSRGKRHADARIDASAFPTRQILPDGMWPETTDPVSLYVEPLFFAGRRLGYLVVERGDSDGSSYTRLASRLANILDGAFLIRDLGEKITELKKANAKIARLSKGGTPPAP